MQHHRVFRAIAACALLVSAAHAQNARWAAGFAQPGPSPAGTEVCTFDAGAGERLYVASDDPHSSPPIQMIRRHDGLVWDDFHAPVNGRVLASCVWDDGTGAALYLAGEFTQIGGVAAARIARFDGTSFTSLGAGLTSRVDALAVHDDGSGSALYAVGLVGVARWSGSSWTPMPQPAGLPTDVVSFDDGSGPALFVSGDLLGPNGTDPNVAQWDGATWTYMPFLSTGHATALCVHDDGSGPALFAANKASSQLSQVVRWNGTFWTAVGPAFNNTVHELHSAGSGLGLVALGEFTSIGTTTARAAVRWNGTQWSAISDDFVQGTCHPTWFSAATFHPPGGNVRIALTGCFFGNTPGAKSAPFVWDGQRTRSLFGAHGLSSTVASQVVHDDGSGEALYAGGSFSRAGDVTAYRIARWNGAAWANVGSGLDSGVNALVRHDEGTGPQLYAGCDFGVRRWDGTSWTNVGAIIGMVTALAVHDDGSGLRLFASTQAFDFQVSDYVNRVQRWDGSAWTNVGDRFDELIEALAVHDSGSGPKLYAGGSFSLCGTTPVPRVAVLSGGSWNSLGSGPNGSVFSLLSFDDGGGPALIAGGLFASAGAVPAMGIAAWRNSSWSAMGAGLGLSVSALGVHDDGGGPALYAGGSFTASTPGGTARRVARWNGVDWSPLGDGVEGSASSVRSFASFQSAWTTGPVLTVGGFFGLAGGKPSAHFTQWGGDHEGIAACFGDGLSAPCPCGNASATGAGTGCANSSGLGSRLRSSGEASLTSDTFQLIGSGMPGSSFLTYFQGTTIPGLGAGAPFNDGLRCVTGNVLRIANLQNQGGASTVPNAQFPTPISVRGLVPPGGGTRVYQALHRDIAGPCGTFANLTNAIVVTWRP
ncbi:MAG: hypothetical protein JNK02_12235 [Planctomycetes bacterium]|nr:hypothetical protein [Planctomycetota bacterium]